jgi:CTP:molybdopterin cytidylyltransferase MocA
VILAGGGSTRFGSDAKQLTPFRGVPMVRRAADAALEAGVFVAVAVVAGAVELEEVLPVQVAVLHNPLWAQGQASSLQVALRWASSLGVDAIVVGLADQPMVVAEAWRLVAETPCDNPILVATYDGSRGNPVRLAAEVWDLLPTSGDEGARALVRKRPELAGEIPCPGTMVDIDTQEDFDRWN